ncbi:MAG TPA: hypothetical protein VK195_10395, partial [Burkholderiaceae bacterium]|nr:hypothetical protein [Burkholderiaceae bacterium]
RGNHPVQWRRPQRLGGTTAGELAGEPVGEPVGIGLADRIDLAEVDVVLQWRVQAPGAPGDHLPGPGHPLYAALQALKGEDGVSLLAVEPLRRQTLGTRGPEGRRVVEHFGFVDGLSQPRFVASPAPRPRDELALGELLLGHANDRGDEDSSLADDPVLADGSFLVIRKLRQFPERLERRLEAEVRRLAEQGIRISVAEIKAAMMGRKPSGEPLVPPDGPGPNDFDYRADPQGLQCPLASHIRRANPREGAPNPHCAGGREPVPRLLRRGMSYGPDLSAEELAGTAPARERGLVFMACNASIAEQFEVVQRWISGGNATGLGSAQSDPLLGVPSLGDRRSFRFVREQPDGRLEVIRIFLDEEIDPQRPVLLPQPFVQLEWGLYAFLPSLAALRHLAGQAAPALAPAPQPTPVSEAAQEGEQLIRQLLGPLKPLGAAPWKQCLEDLVARRQGVPDKVWAAVRELHGGALDTGTDYGVLVGSPALLESVLLDPGGRYSVSGYQARMDQSIGPIYLGLDAGADYEALAAPVNRLIGRISRAWASHRRSSPRLSTRARRQQPSTVGRKPISTPMQVLASTPSSLSARASNSGRVSVPCSERGSARPCATQARTASSSWRPWRWPCSSAAVPSGRGWKK